jgi:predicted transcriptional regulator/DNA-binding XRE family transcriptional regulator
MSDNENPVLAKDPIVCKSISCKYATILFAKKNMAAGKLYIGRKVRDLRDASRFTQAVFAERLGISTSYLNQIENNQRPVSATVLLALADKFKMDISELSAGSGDRLVSALSETLSDPLFANYVPSIQELKLVAQNAPGFAHALLNCHEAYRQRSEQLASHDDRLDDQIFVENTPYEEVRDFFHFVDNYIHEVDQQAESLAQELGLAEQDTFTTLTQFLDRRYGVRLCRDGEVQAPMRRFDPIVRELTLNRYLPAPTRDFQVALQIAQLYGAETIDAVASAANFKTQEGYEICRIGLHNYFAGALLLPYEVFKDTAAELRHDLELLSTRFGASLEQVCHRLSTLQRPGAKGVPLFFARIDRSGNITKRHSATKLQFARFGAACPLWIAHQAPGTPGQIMRQLAETPDGVRYLCLATQTSKAVAGYKNNRPTFTLALGCEITYADAFVYADDLDISNQRGFDPIGVSCRLCERRDCTSRSVPPLRQKIAVDHHLRAMIPYKL